ncbi:uncharacterized protein zgc:66455 [Hippocampus zosterae]|uniref:uncharacterized protein zgc:66455 n=1 Tax=Hippocampus zosterae TaxID=109293 RepID=UPI00223DCD66|nr:uncharacterized protein zgc:66455 [Hippocampus zosterae]
MNFKRRQQQAEQIPATSPPKMLAYKAATLPSHALVLSFVLGPLWTSCEAQLLEDEAKPISGAAVEGGGAFFALRSCHQRLGGDDGDFFSPDYVCANPPLWCNWSIRAPAGKRVHLHLQDLTPDEDCHLKEDRIYVDEPADPSAGTSARHRVLRGCWREATYASGSDTLRVVLLIGGRPARQYRGFYARYRSFGPDTPYRSPDGASAPDGNRDPWDWGDLSPMTAGQGERHPTATADVFPVFDYPGKAADSSAGPDVRAQDSKIQSEITQTSESPHRTSPAERGAPGMLSDSPDLAGPPRKHLNRFPGGSLHAPTAERRDAEPPEDQHRPAEVGQNEMEVVDASSSPKEQKPGRTLPPPNLVEALSAHRVNVWNASQVRHEPGDQLFEVSVEVQLGQEGDPRQERLDGLLMKSLKALVLRHLDSRHTPLSLTFKRIKRLRAGELYIMWLNTGRGGSQMSSGVHRDLHEMVGSALGPAGNPHRGVVASVSVGDVNECGTQLALCDVNADCLDQFGSYGCRCKDGFRDESHLGPAGTVCVQQEPTGCSRGPSGETKVVYVLFFLLSSLLLMSLAAACALYGCRRRGSFPLKGQPSHSDGRFPDAAASDPPPPPPPARGPRDSWALHKERRAAVDLPLLRFSPLTPSDVYADSQEGGKK